MMDTCNRHELLLWQVVAAKEITNVSHVTRHLGKDAMSTWRERQGYGSESGVLQGASSWCGGGGGGRRGRLMKVSTRG
jgi:hypothetical protein